MSRDERTRYTVLQLIMQKKICRKRSTRRRRLSWLGNLSKWFECASNKLFRTAASKIKISMVLANFRCGEGTWRKRRRRREEGVSQKRSNLKRFLCAKYLYRNLLKMNFISWVFEFLNHLVYIYCNFKILCWFSEETVKKSYIRS